MEDNNTIDENSNNSHSSLLFISITKFSQNPQNQIIFNLQLHSDITNKSWELIQSFESLYKYHQYLLVTFSNLPSFPDHDFASLNLQKTKVILEIFLSEILKRNDIITNPETEKLFLLSTNHYKDFYKYQPTLIINDFHSHYLSQSRELGFIISFFNNELSLIDFIPHTKSFIIQTKTQCSNNICCINHSKFGKMNFVLAGLVDGTIELFTLITSPITKQFLLEKTNVLKPHNKIPILNFAFDPSIGYIYSVAVNSNVIVISEINYEKIISSSKLHSNISKITAFAYDSSNNIIFISDSSNSIYIFRIFNYIQFTMLQAYHGNLGNVSILKYNNDINSLLVGTNISKSALFYYDRKLNQIQKVGRVKCDKSQRFKVVGIAYRKQYNEMIVSLSNGKVQFWSSNKTIPDFVLDCCCDHQYDICYNEDKNILISNCVDNMVKIYKLPDKWMIRETVMKNKEDSVFDKNAKEGIEMLREECNEDIKLDSDSAKNSQRNSITNSNENEECEYNSSLDGWDEDPYKEEVMHNMLDLNISVPIVM